METGVRKKRTLAERRESDKLRQRRFRAKKREEARLLEAITGVVEVQKPERSYSTPKKTAEEIRETNRIRQQRFRAKRRDGGSLIDSVLTMEVKKEIEQPEEVPTTASVSQPPTDPADIVQRILLQAASDEKTRLTEIRREKDRIRKRRERQRKKDHALKEGGLTTEQILKHLTGFQQSTQEKDQPTEPQREYENTDEFAMEVDPAEADDVEETKEIHEFDAQHIMAQLVQMGLVLGESPSSDGSDESPVLEIKEMTPETSESTSSPPPSSILDVFTLEKKPWQRCNTSEERRERERMRKRMYRAKRRFISTGKLEMQWDPSPIKRSPNDDPEDGITPLPDWSKSSSAEERQAAHRIYNKRYRERLKYSVMREEASRSQSREPSLTSKQSEDGVASEREISRLECQKK
ncbi:Protein CBG08239 [Caenorhabditis briggsae]|uniref:Uncharacterized protein n=2 Tax=Caenorhabditis briggsae TaxID=6238 RepID=A0AAE9E4B4_CAEBR|nr:Protein CBG08239 [Caenorhabditis briggsae]ULU11144.1 hypothetical protein L3Y34_014971 [Caenorhabditis briggsae]UMM12104.1 hypothetical protein L5515_001054 [Caenorhabditis briggsae]CAP28105.1 Protein CBG08239 [Caenorhabditis briggsae]